MKMLVLVVGMTGWAGAQGTPTVGEVSAEVRAAADVFEARLPSLTCHESTVIEKVKDGTVKKTMRLEGAIEIRRTEDARHPFVESHRFDSVDGVALAEHKSPKRDYWVEGMFANGLPGHGPVDTEPCYEKKVEAAGNGLVTYTIDRRAGTDGLGVCREYAEPGLKRVMLVDAAGHVVKVVRTLPADVAKDRKDVGYAEIAYGPVTLGSEELWIPQQGETHDAKDEYRQTTRYTGCRRYGGSITVLPGVQKVSGGPE